MIIDLDLLKSKLGITGDDADAALTVIADEQTAWVEGETHRRFSPPEQLTVTIAGQGSPIMWLPGHIEIPAPVDTPEWADVIVAERIAWTTSTVLDTTVYEVRGGKSLASLVRVDGFVWSIGAEYDITFYDGYATAPLDIQLLVMALSVAAHRLDAATADGSAGITSETLVGVYSYNIDRRRASLESDGTLSDQSARTINRWKRGMV